MQNQWIFGLKDNVKLKRIIERKSNHKIFVFPVDGLAAKL